jgi:hypothetical protein
MEMTNGQLILPFRQATTYLEIGLVDLMAIHLSMRFRWPPVRPAHRSHLTPTLGPRHTPQEQAV